MATQQYLFRVYHNLLEQEVPAFFYTAQGLSSQQLKTCELTYTDHLHTFPENTVDLVAHASQLAYADACLHLDTEIVLVVAWLLDDEKPADQSTPVLVLHPFQLKRLRPQRTNPSYFGEQWPADFTLQNIYVGLTNGGLADAWRTGVSILLPGYGFPSYNLRAASWSSPSPRAASDGFTVLRIKRAVTRGRLQPSVHKRVVAPEDVQFSERHTLILNTQGTLYWVRFPLYREVLETMKYAHSGWSMQLDGRLVRREIALSKHYIGGVSDMAQQRRMAHRRSHGVRLITREWYKVVRLLMTWFWLNQEHGKPWRTTIAWEDVSTTNTPSGPVQSREQGSVAYTRVPWPFLYLHIQDVRRFINLWGVASGNNTLLVPDLFNPEQRAEIEYNNLRNELRDSTAKVSYVASKGKTRQLDVTRALADLVASITLRLAAYSRRVRRFEQANPFYSYRTKAQAKALAKIHNEFAAEWPALQADFLSVLSLLMTWQLTWDVAEPTRSNSATQQIDRNPFSATDARYFSLYPVRLIEPRGWPDLATSRWAYERVNWLPFRLWGELRTDDVDEEGERRREEEEVKERQKKFYEELERKRLEEEAAERKKWTDRMDELKKEIAKDAPNPADPWDYRNWTDATSREKFFKRQWDAEFFARAIDVPDQLDPYRQVLRFSKRSQPGSLKKGVKGAPTKEFIEPAAKRHAVIPWARIRRILIDEAKDAAKEYAQDWLEDQVVDLIKSLEDSDQKYSPRQVWPPEDEWEGTLDALRQQLGDASTTPAT